MEHDDMGSYTEVKVNAKDSSGCAGGEWWTRNSVKRENAIIRHNPNFSSQNDME